MKFFNLTLLYLLSFSLLFYSCASPDDELVDIVETPDEPAYLELEIDESLLSYNSDFWIVLTNDDGEILTDSLIRTGGKVDFIEHVSEISDYLGIYFFKIFHESKSYSVEAILNIEKGSTLSFNNTWNHGNPEIGTVDVEITNFPNTYLGINLLATSNTQGFAHKSSETIDSDPYDLVVDTIRFKMSIVKENDTLLIGNSFKDNDPRYLKIEGVNDGESYLFDFVEDFIPYNQIVTHEAPPSDNFRIKSFVFGYKDQSSFYTSMRYTSWSYRFTQFGYVNGFDNYKTIYGVGGLQGYDEVGFVKRGEAVNSEELELPQYSVSITDTTFINFDYSYTRALAYRKATWTSEDRESNLYIYEDLTNKCKQLSNLPDKISSQYDFINLDKLDFVQCEFIENVEGFSYTNYFGEIYSNYPQENEYKYYLLSIR